MLGQDAPLEARIRKRLVLLIEALKDNPRFLQLVLNEIYSHADTPERMDTLQGVAARGLALSEALLVAREGDPPLDAIDPRFLHVAFLGLCTFFVDAQPMLKVLFNGEQGAEDLTGRVMAHEAAFRAALDSLADIPIVGDIRGMGYFYGIELVKDRDTRESFTDEEGERLLRQLLSPRIFELGLYCRADDRGDPVIQLSPPLVAGPEQFEEIAGVLRTALTESVEAIR